MMHHTAIKYNTALTINKPLPQYFAKFISQLFVYVGTGIGKNIQQ